MGVSLKDLIDLAKAGYTHANIRELILLSEKAEPQKTEEPKEPAGAPIEPKPAETKPEENKAPIEPKPAETKPEENKAPEKEQEEKPEETVDYKALYEKTVADLKAAQEANRSGSQPEETPEDAHKHLTETIASFM